MAPDAASREEEAAGSDDGAGALGGGGGGGGRPPRSSDDAAADEMEREARALALLDGPEESEEAAAAAARRQRSEALLQMARAELLELQSYAAQLPALQLPQRHPGGGERAPLTLVVSVVDLSCPAHKVLTSCIAFAAERVFERVAAFEIADLACDEIDIEVWTSAVNYAAGGAADAYGVPPPSVTARVQPESLLGGCTVGVHELLVGEQTSFAGALPLCDGAGVVVGTARVLVEVREPQQPTGY